MNSGVYKILNIVNGKFYIGSSNNIHKRFIMHKSYLNNNKHVNNILQNSWNKYGAKNFEFSILSYCPSEYCIKLEQWFIDNLNPQYNISKVAGKSNKGLKLSEEHIRKIQQTRILKGINKVCSDRMLNNTYAKGSKRTVEEINKLHLSRNNKIGIKVLQVETGIIFNTMSDLAKNLNVCKQAVHKAIKNSTKCKGYNLKIVKSN